MAEALSVSNSNNDNNGGEATGGAAFRAVLQNPNFLRLWMAQQNSELRTQNSVKMCYDVGQGG